MLSYSSYQAYMDIAERIELNSEQRKTLEEILRNNLR